LQYCAKKIQELEVDVASSFNQRLRELEGQKTVEAEFEQEIKELRERLSKAEEEGGKGAGAHKVITALGDVVHSKRVKELEEALGEKTKEANELAARVSQLEYFSMRDDADQRDDSDEEDDLEVVSTPLSPIEEGAEGDDWGASEAHESAGGGTDESAANQLPSVLKRNRRGDQGQNGSLSPLPKAGTVLSPAPKTQSGISTNKRLFALPHGRISGQQSSPAHWQPISSLSQDEVIKLLKALQLDPFVRQFRRDSMDGKALTNISEAYLENIGMKLFLRRAFIQLVNEHRVSGFPRALIDPKALSGQQTDEDCVIF